MGFLIYILIGFLLSFIRTILHVKYLSKHIKNKFDDQFYRTFMYFLYIVAYPIVIFIDLVIVGYVFIIKVFTVNEK